MRGIFISLEGIDGAGKSSHIARLQAHFLGQGRQVTLTREPGGTPLAEQLRGLVLNAPMDPLAEALLVFAARQDHLARIIRPALARGDVVLCDRFADASFAYQGGGRGLDWGVLQQLEAWVQYDAVQGLLQPELTLWFDLPPAVAAVRLAGARVPDRFESQPESFFTSVAQAYARRCAESPDRFACIAADQPQEAVWSDISAVLVQRGWA